MLAPVVALVTSVMIARVAGPTGRGQIVALATWAQVLGWAGGLSIDKALLARRGDDGRRHAADVPMAAGLSALLSAGALAAVLSVAVGRSVLDGAVFVAALPVAVFGTVAVDARAATLLARGDWRSYVLLRIGQPVTYLLGCALTAVSAPEEHAVVGFVLALCVSGWLPALLVGGLPRLRVRRPDGAQLRVLFAFAGAYHLGSVLSVLNTRFDVLAMSVRFTAAEVGVYAVAASAGQVVALLGSAGLMRGLAGRVGPAGRIDRAGLALAALLAVSVAAAAGWLVPAVFGDAFAGAVWPARILCLSGLLVYLTQALNGQLAGSGRPWATVAVNGAGTLTFAALLPFADTIVEVAVVNVTAAAGAAATALYLAIRLKKVG